MKKEQQTIDELLEEFKQYLKREGRHPNSIKDYNYTWIKVRSFMISNKIQFYDKTVEERYLKSAFGDINYTQLSKRNKRIVNVVESLHEFQTKGTVPKIKTNRKVIKVFSGGIGDAILSYIEHKQLAVGLSDKTTTNYKIYLYDLLLYLNSKNINALDELRKIHVFDYLKNMNTAKRARMHLSTIICRGFFKHLHEQRLTSEDYSKVLMKVNYRRQYRLPSTFTNEEIKTLLTSIDRASATGKRDYAIILMATKLGIRSSDIVALKFENIQWENNLISFTQAKTGKAITYPLLPEVGNAIIDYLKYGRPISNESNCFLQAWPPYKNMRSGSICTLVRFNLTRAGINLTNRKHGPHALRHSFAANLLMDKTPLPVISEALGHSYTQSTMYYIRIDKETLRQCVLDVPFLSMDFFYQKGGLSHE